MSHPYTYITAKTRTVVPQEENMDVGTGENLVGLFMLFLYCSIYFLNMLVLSIQKNGKKQTKSISRCCSDLVIEMSVQLGSPSPSPLPRCLFSLVFLVLAYLRMMFQVEFPCSTSW